MSEKTPGKIAEFAFREHMRGVGDPGNEWQAWSSAAESVIAEHVSKHPPVEPLSDEERAFVDSAREWSHRTIEQLVALIDKRFPRQKRWEPCTPGQALDHDGGVRWRLSAEQGWTPVGPYFAWKKLGEYQREVDA